jgi:hypothetical protein
LLISPRISKYIPTSYQAPIPQAMSLRDNFNYPIHNLSTAR